MLSQEQIQNNKIKFLELIKQINIEGANIDGLIQFLETSDFFTAPASTKYHNDFEGGLCAHSLKVYEVLCNLFASYKELNNKYDMNSLLVCGLLHDLSKANYYELYTQNSKKYYDGGSKHDNKGKFDWFAEDKWKVRDAKDRIILGNHEVSSMMLVSRYIPLTDEESIAISHHHCNMNDGNQFYDLTPVLNRNRLLALLHAADFISCFTQEETI